MGSSAWYTAFFTDTACTRRNSLSNRRLSQSPLPSKLLNRWPNIPREIAADTSTSKYRIRERLLAREMDASHDGHTLHCLDYVRQALMCNIDVMLGATGTYEDFGMNGTHVCRDYDAVTRWAQANQWKGFFVELEPSENISSFNNPELKGFSSGSHKYSLCWWRHQLTTL